MKLKNQNQIYEWSKPFWWFWLGLQELLLQHIQLNCFTTKAAFRMTFKRKFRSPIATFYKKIK
jgi:hypothetical protein